MRSALLTFLMLAAVPVIGGGAWEGTCVRVIDGDTIVVRQGVQDVRVRLYGIDCPERGRAFSREATQFTERLVLSKRVTVAVRL